MTPEVIFNIWPAATVRLSVILTGESIAVQVVFDMTVPLLSDWNRSIFPVSPIVSMEDSGTLLLKVWLPTSNDTKRINTRENTPMMRVLPIICAHLLPSDNRNNYLIIIMSVVLFICVNIVKGAKLDILLKLFS